MADRSDVSLLRAWQAGDAKAGTEMFRRHFAAVFRFFRNKTASDVEDLVQRTFLACLEGLDRYRADASFRTFLFSIARNLLYKHYDGKRREARDLDFGLSSVWDLAPTPSGILVEHDEQRLLVKALRRIPVDYQIALELYHWEGLTGPELAAVLDVPEPTIRSRIRRGTAMLRRRMRELAESDRILKSTLTSLDAWARSIRERVGPKAPVELATRP